MNRVWRKITKTTDFGLKGRVLKVSINIKQNSLLSFKKKFDTFTKPKIVFLSLIFNFQRENGRFYGRRGRGERGRSVR